MKQVCKTILWLLMLLSIAGCSLFAGQPGATAQTPPSANATAETSTGVGSPPLAAHTPLPTLAAPTTAPPDVSTLPRLADLSEGWNKIDPGGKTTCARGGEYSFSVRKTNSNKVLIYFEGGGSCYDANTCRDGGNYFDASIDYSFVSDNPEMKADGVFALNSPANPFGDYNIVFINYCTGDGYMGAKTAEYTYDGYTFAVQHMGFENTRTVLEWTYENFVKPESLFMIGCSAGVTGAFMHAPYILEHYQNVPTTLIGDSGGPFIDGPAVLLNNYGVENLFAPWLPAYQQITADGVVHSRMFFSIPAQAYPTVKFGLLDTTEDGVQMEILSRFSKTLKLSDAIKNNLTAVRADAPGFLSYNGPGDHHCITMSPAFNEYSVNGVRLDDWFARLEAGQTVQNVSP